MPEKKPPRKNPATVEPYHHGDLKNAAVEAAELLLAETGVEGFSLREIARRLGVSHAAVYRHYPDKQALLADLARIGFVRMKSALVRAGSGSQLDSENKLRRVLEAYLTFAHKYTACFRLMYGPDLAKREQFPALAAAAEESFDALMQILEQAQQNGILRPGPVEMIGATAFALAHGLAALTINGLMRAGSMKELPRTTIVDQTWQFLWQGIGAPALATSALP